MRRKLQPLRTIIQSSSRRKNLVQAGCRPDEFYLNEAAVISLGDPVAVRLMSNKDAGRQKIVSRNNTTAALLYALSDHCDLRVTSGTLPNGSCFCLWDFHTRYRSVAPTEDRLYVGLQAYTAGEV